MAGKEFLPAIAYAAFTVREYIKIYVIVYNIHFPQMASRTNYIFASLSSWKRCRVAIAIMVKGRPFQQQKGQGCFGRKKININGRSRKKLRGDVRAESETKEMAKTAKHDDEHDVGDDEATATAAQHLQVESEELLQDIINYEDTTYEEYEDNHFLTAKVKEELGDFFDRKDEVKRMCVVYLFVTVHDANPDEATWSGKHGIINKIRKAMKLPAKSQLEYILQDALDHRRRGKNMRGNELPM
jgi:hypothetical protein